jgi:Domain of unknown function (DUF4396)
VAQFDDSKQYYCEDPASNTRYGVNVPKNGVVDNAVIVAIPGAMDAGLANWLFWVSLAVSLAISFVVTVPVNRWLIGRGKGHAVVHGYHDIG